jgi:hypothetical protein
MVLSIVLSSMIEALGERPDRYDIILNNENSNNNAQKQDAVLEVANRLSKALIEKLVNQTMETLESQTEAQAEDTESIEVVAKADDTEAAATEEEEIKPEEE